MFVFNAGGQWYQYHSLPPLDVVQDNGILAYGNDYSVAMFEKAYRRGVFPWPAGDEMEDELIPWCCPPERFVLDRDHFRVKRTVRQSIRKHDFEICADRAFDEVVALCSRYHREKDGGTWITDKLRRTFGALHRRGFAHSVECYRDGHLVGGFYGTCIGSVFGGESMFMLEADASKAAFVAFALRAFRYGIQLIDCQCYTENMARYGAWEMARGEFLATLEMWRDRPVDEGMWKGVWQEWKDAI